MMDCNHPRPTGDRGSLGCPYASQGYEDQKTKPMKPQSSFANPGDFRCYEHGYKLGEHDCQAGQKLLKMMLGL